MYAPKLQTPHVTYLYKEKVTIEEKKSSFVCAPI